MSDLLTLINDYFIAQRAWRALSAQDDTTDAPSPEWDAYEAAEDAILQFPCRTHEEVTMKVAFVLADDNAFDSVRTCFREVGDRTVWTLTAFLRSLLGGLEEDPDHIEEKSEPTLATVGIEP
jgi:hypothetical protein